MEEGTEAVGFEVELRCDLVRAVLFELEVVEADFLVGKHVDHG